MFSELTLVRKELSARQEPVHDFHQIFHDTISSCKESHTALAPKIKRFVAASIKARYSTIRKERERYIQENAQWRSNLLLIERNSADSEQVSHEPVTAHVNSLLAYATPTYDSPTSFDDRWEKTCATIPDMRCASSKTLFNNRFKNDNRREPSSTVDLFRFKIWSDAEQRTFIQKFLIYSKSFHKIAAYLPFKSTSDCVRFYYKNKRKLQLNALLFNYRKNHPIDLDAVLNR